jgi:hypothetical protein
LLNLNAICESNNPSNSFNSEVKTREINFDKTISKNDRKVNSVSTFLFYKLDKCNTSYNCNKGQFTWTTKTVQFYTSGLDYNPMTIVNDGSRVFNVLETHLLMMLELSFTDRK